MSQALRQLRHLVRDENNPEKGFVPFFDDETMLDFLAMNEQNVYAAAADVLRAWAIDITVVNKKIELTNAMIDGPAMSKILLMSAESMEMRARDRTLGKPPQVGVL